MYPDIVMEHFMHPRNVGKIKNPTSVGEFENEARAKAVFYVVVEDGVVTDIKYQVAGCPFAIAVCSLISEYAKTKRVEELKVFSMDDVKRFFEIPEDKEDCIKLSINAFLNAIIPLT